MGLTPGWIINFRLKYAGAIVEHDGDRGYSRSRQVQFAIAVEVGGDVIVPEEGVGSCGEGCRLRRGVRCRGKKHDVEKQPAKESSGNKGRCLVHFG